MQMASEVELHLRGDLPKLKPGDLRRLLARVETALRRGGYPTLPDVKLAICPPLPPTVAEPSPVAPGNSLPVQV